MPSEVDATLVVRDVSVDREGDPVYGGALTFRFEPHTPDAVVQRLRDRSLGLNGALRFSLDATQSTNRSLHVSLDRTSGPALTQEYRPAQNAVALQNATESPLVLRRLLFGTEAPESPAIHSLDGVELRPNETHTASLPTEDDRRFGAEVVSLLVPPDRYLQPEHRIISYQVTFHLAAAPGSEEECTTDWLDHNYGHSTNLTVRRQQLRALVPDSA